MAPNDSQIPNPAHGEEDLDKGSSSDNEKLDSHDGDVAAEVEAELAAPLPPSNAAPNGGLKAWLQVLGSWMLIFNTWGEHACSS